jgi:transcriptional regulator with XRE-family HTH domain
MDNTMNIKNLLGMKQEYMSMLLQVTRSQWSMYVLGKRDLPFAAKLKLAEMLGFLQQKNVDTKKKFQDDKAQNLKIAQFLKSQQLANTNMQTITKQKLKAIEQKYEIAVTAIQFIDFLETNSEKPTAAYQLLLQTIKQNAESEIEKNGLAIQAKLRFKYEMLQEEEFLLNKKLS